MTPKQVLFNIAAVTSNGIYLMSKAHLANWPNTAVNSPNKIFVSVPVDSERKKQWFKAIKRDMPKSKSRFNRCEDHFNVSMKLIIN